MENLILIKIGGSLITDKTKPFTTRPDAIKRIAKEIKEALDEKDMKLLIGHGGGSFPHQSAKKYQTNKGIINDESYRGIAEVQNDASRLNRIFVQALIDEGINAVSIQPSAGLVAEDGKIVDWYTKSLEQMLEKNLLPIPYGDVALDTTKGCTILSTEMLLNYLARKLKPKKIIIAGEVDGVFTADPHKDPNAKLIPEITTSNFEEMKKYLEGSRGTDVTGGMLHKVEEMLELAQEGFTSEIINVLKEGNLKKAILGEEGIGTIIRKA
jgi:isopentenyl phosphate kinase